MNRPVFSSRLRRQRWRGGLLLWALRLGAFLLGIPILLIVIYAVVPPLTTSFMLTRALEGYDIEWDWVPYDTISPHLVRAAIAAEDSKFCSHGGFDWQALRHAANRYTQGEGQVLGGSTISMQTSKNLFLWEHRDFVRKGYEAYITVWLEMILSKRRIMEIYLNVVEWGEGVFGAEAAARHHFNKSAAALTPVEAARLIAVLPSPLARNPAQPGPQTAARARTIAARAQAVSLGENGPCR